ncbi:hypothetical protein N0V95_008498 [Ascochyta clinopodiicola]|nr:hypothetical protein N0V95_008498 [Ascochyta clinopodiicola]
MINRERYLSGDPETNRFGTTRFLTFPEAKDMLTECFSWAISNENPELGTCPIVVLGHALHNDLPKLLPLVGFDYLKSGNVVKQIDTQDLARSTGYWSGHSGQPVGLKNLVKNIVRFEYRDEHTACNDIGMTVVAAVQMVLPAQFKTAQNKSLQEVVDHIEQTSKKTKWSHGSSTYCLRCNKRGHLKKHCRASIKPCKHCTNSGVESRQSAARGHESHKCLSHAKDAAKAAREALKVTNSFAR